MREADEGNRPDRSRGRPGGDHAAHGSDRRRYLYGQICDMDAIAEVAESRGLFVLEDAAQAHGALYRFPAPAPPPPERSRCTRARTWAHSETGAPSAPTMRCSRRACAGCEISASGQGRARRVGFNERLDGRQAALLRVKLPYLDAWNDARRMSAERSRESLSAEVTLLQERPSPCVYHLMLARFENRDAIAAELRTRGIETGIDYAPAMDGHPALDRIATVSGEIRAAQAWAAEELSLPMHPDLSGDEVEYVADAVIEAIVITANAGEA